MPFNRAKESCIWGLISILDFRQSSSTSETLLEENHEGGSHHTSEGNGNPDCQLLVPKDVKEKDKHSHDKKGNTLGFSTSKQITIRALVEKEMRGIKSGSLVNVATPTKPLCLKSRNKSEPASSDFLNQSLEIIPFIRKKDFSSRSNNLEEIKVQNSHENAVLRRALNISFETILIDEGLRPTEFFSGEEIVHDRYLDNHKGKYIHSSKESFSSPCREASVHKFPKSRFKSRTRSNNCNKDPSCTSQLQLQIQDRTGGFSSYFSFRKIRKTLKQAMSDFVLTQFDGELAPRNTNINLTISGDRKHRIWNATVCENGELGTLADYLCKEDAFDRKAKKHITKTLNRRAKNEISSTSKIPKTLAEAIFPIYDHIFPASGDMEIHAAGHILYSDSLLVSREESIDCLMKTSCHSRDGPTFTSRNELEAEHSTSACGQNSKDDRNLELSSELNLRSAVVFSAENQEEGSSTSSDLSSFHEEQKPEELFIYSTLPNSSHKRKIEIPLHLNEKVQSPVSVLEGVFVNNAKNSPQRKADDPSEETWFHHIKACLQLREATCYLETNSNSFSLQKMVGYLEDHGHASESACINPSELFKMWNSPHQSLSPTLVGKIQQWTSTLLDDKKLLFDCGDEVLRDIWKNLLVCLPWTRLIRPNAKPFPNERDLFQEFNKGIDCRINAHYAITMDELVEMHLNSESWVDLFYDEEGALVEVVDDILIDLLEEYIVGIMNFISKHHEIDPQTCNEKDQSR